MDLVRRIMLHENIHYGTSGAKKSFEIFPFLLYFKPYVYELETVITSLKMRLSLKGTIVLEMFVRGELNFSLAN